MAQAAWELGNEYTISDDQAKSGGKMGFSPGTKNITIMGECQSGESVSFLRVLGRLGGV
jgi:hypothetical protein